MRPKKKRAEFTKKQRKWISKKIGFLIREEGLALGHASGKAYGMARTRFGKKKRHPKRRR